MDVQAQPNPAPPSNQAAPPAEHTPDARTIRQVLARVWTVLWVRELLRALVALGIMIPIWGLLLEFAILSTGHNESLLSYTNFWPMALGYVLAALLVFPALRAPRAQKAAATMDKLAQTGDRISTALRFSTDRAHPTDPWRQAAVRECVAYLRNVNVWKHLELPSRAMVLLALGLWVGYATFFAVNRNMNAPTPAERQALEEERQRQLEIAQQMEQVAEKLEGNSQDPAAKEMAAKLRETAKELAGNQAPRAEELRAAALKQLAMLEAATRAELERRAESSSLDQQDAKALAEALKGSPEFSEAGRSLAEGKNTQAAKQIQDTLSRLDNQAKQDAVDAVAAALSRQDPARKPDVQKANSAGQDAMKALASQQTPQAMQALQQLAKMLQEMGNTQQGQPSPGSQQTEQQSQQALARLMKALENLKEKARGGEGQPMIWPGDEMGEQGEGETFMVMSDSTASNQPGDSTSMMSSAMSSPDSSRGMDSGTVEPLGDKPFDAGHMNSSEGLRLNSILGEGESLVTLTPSAAPGTKASARYQEVYQAAEPAMQEALNREDIPLGSREIIKRYFEEIRP